MEYKEWIEPRMREAHAQDEIIFALDCPCCGQTYRAFPVRFDKTLEFLAQAKKEARRQAISDFTDILTRCPCCSRFVCQRCVVVDERGHLCKNCAENEPGGVGLHDV